MKIVGKIPKDENNEDIDDVDFPNYKGIYDNDDIGPKFIDEITGAHFNYADMCRKLLRIQQELNKNRESSTSVSDIKGSFNANQMILTAFKAAQAEQKAKEGRNEIIKKYQSFDNRNNKCNSIVAAHQPTKASNKVLVLNSKDKNCLANNNHYGNRGSYGQPFITAKRNIQEQSIKKSILLHDSYCKLTMTNNENRMASNKKGKERYNKEINLCSSMSIVNLVTEQSGVGRNVGLKSSISKGTQDKQHIIKSQSKASTSTMKRSTIASHDKKSRNTNTNGNAFTTQIDKTHSKARIPVGNSTIKQRDNVTGIRMSYNTNLVHNQKPSETVCQKPINKKHVQKANIDTVSKRCKENVNSSVYFVLRR
jgi:hypothetical protein